MKKIVLLFVLITTFVWTGCDNDCPSVCYLTLPPPPPPNVPVCQAIQGGWFYNPSISSCELIWYVSCGGPQGFATQAECDSYCLCD